jgi:hypothetical protein
MHVARKSWGIVAVGLFLAIVSTATAKYSGGTGEPNDPYQIATAADLIALGETPEDYNKHFILTADIDLDPKLPGREVFDKAVIGPTWETRFTGVFDGKGHTISHLTISGESYLGLFGHLAVPAEVKGLGVVDVNIAGSGWSVGGLAGCNHGGTLTQCNATGRVSGNDCVGGLVGHSFGTVTRCRSTGTIGGESMVGGLVGGNGEGGLITQCYSVGTVSGSECVGGLVGYNVYGDVTRCYSTAAVSGYRSVGGLVGENDGGVTDCYSMGPVTGTAAVGGLVGSNYGYVTQCLSTGKVGGNNLVGGLVGYNENEGTVVDSVWDLETSGLFGSREGVGLTTAEMQDPHMLGLNGFANDPNWVLDAGRDYPRLAWEGRPGEVIPDAKMDWLEGRGTTEVPYRIDAADQLILLGRASALWDRHFILGADIDLDPNLPNRQVLRQALIPRFFGVFDGNGHAIMHLTIKGGEYLGLFGHTKSGAEIRGLGAVDVNIAGTRDYVGGLVGSNGSWDEHGGGSVTNCYSTGMVTSTGDYVGGLVGDNYGSVVQCHSAVTVSGNEDVGGLAGDHHGSLTECNSSGIVTGICYVGGLVGDNYGSVTQCYSTGAVDGSDYVGGLVGENYYGNVTQCHSTSTVSGSGSVGGLVGSTEGGSVAQCHSDGAVDGNDYVGGLVGSNGGSVTGCYSSGAVDGNDGVGGLIGATWDGATSDCYSMASVSGRNNVGGLVGVGAVLHWCDWGLWSTRCYSSATSISRCYSTGAVTGESNVGGLVGSDERSEVQIAQCFWDTETSGQAVSAAGTGKTTAEMQTAKTFLEAGWDFAGETANGTEDIWWINEGKDYPRLWWEAGDEASP